MNKSVATFCHGYCGSCEDIMGSLRDVAFFMHSSHCFTRLIISCWIPDLSLLSSRFSEFLGVHHVASWVSGIAVTWEPRYDFHTVCQFPCLLQYGFTDSLTPFVSGQLRMDFLTIVDDCRTNCCFSQYSSSFVLLAGRQTADLCCDETLFLFACVIFCMWKWISRESICCVKCKAAFREHELWNSQTWKDVDEIVELL